MKNLIGSLFTYGLLSAFPCTMTAVYAHQLHHSVIMWIGIVSAAMQSFVLVVALILPKTKSK